MTRAAASRPEIRLQSAPLHLTATPAGVLVSDPAFARALRDQFESLVAERLLLRIPAIRR